MYNYRVERRQKPTENTTTEFSNLGGRSVQNTKAETESKTKKLYTSEAIEQLAREIKMRTVTELKSLEIDVVRSDMVSSIELLFYHILLRGIDLASLSLGDIWVDGALSIPTFPKLESLRIGKTCIGVELEIFAQPLTSFEIGDIHNYSSLSVGSLPNISSISHGKCYGADRLNDRNQKILEDLDRIAAGNVPTVTDFVETFASDPSNQDAQAELDKRFAELMQQKNNDQNG